MYIIYALLLTIMLFTYPVACAAIIVFFILVTVFGSAAKAEDKDRAERMNKLWKN
jgi:hypothetical protein